MIFSKLPKLMGILNVTEDSFSDGSLYLNRDKAVQHALQMIAAGADIIDIGAESTRPGSRPIDPEQELMRVVPIVSMLREHENLQNIQISIDTRNSQVAKSALDAGADMINDISALRHDPQMVDVLASHPTARLVLMHMQGSPQTMQINPVYENVLSEVYAFFEERIHFAGTNGICPSRIIIDPGIGFGKNLEHNLTLIANLKLFRKLGCDLLLGASRKSFINQISSSDPNQRIGGTLAAALYALLQETDIIRIHDVHIHKQFFQVLQAIQAEELL